MNDLNAGKKRGKKKGKAPDSACDPGGTTPGEKFWEQEVSFKLT